MTGTRSPLASEMLRLQRTAGNRAVQRLVRRKAAGERVLARCEGECKCGGRCKEEEDEYESSATRDLTVLKAGTEVSPAEARAIVDGYIDALGPLGATVKPFPTSAGPVPSMLRSPEPSSPAGHGLKFEGGVVGAAQLCYDLCSGELSVTGWVWAGGGVVTKGLFGAESWWGAYVFAEGDLFGPWQLDFMPRVSCGTCSPKCQPGDEHGIHWGAGIAGFPVVIKPGERKVFGKSGIEVGMLLTPHRSGCDADLEAIVLVDITRYIGGPIGAAVKSAVDLAKEMGKKVNIDLDCGVGIAVNGNVHLCKSVPGGGIGGITSDSASICGGGYFGCGIGLSKSKTGLPGMKSSPGPTAAPAPAPAKPPARPPAQQRRRHGRRRRRPGRRRRARVRNRL